VTEWQEAEEAVRKYLRDWFGQEFSKGKLTIRTRERTEEHEFDAVSEDGTIVAEVKHHTHPEHPREMQLAREDVALLYLVEARRRLLFLTDPLFYVVFCRTHMDSLLEWKKMGVEIVSPFELTKHLGK
jgi:hypothetical protein